MHARIFSSKLIGKNKTKFNADIEWHLTPSDFLQKQIIAIHLASFLDLYAPYSEKQLGLKSGMTKQEWLTKMIIDELKEVKEGKLLLGTISLQDQIAGFIICAPITKERYQEFKADVYISLLAVKPFKDKSEKKIHIGLGQQLVESAQARFVDANTLTLDTRRINKDAMKFYEKIGFSSTGKKTFGGSNPENYVGYEKNVMRTLSMT